MKLSLQILLVLLILLSSQRALHSSQSMGNVQKQQSPGSKAPQLIRPGQSVGHLKLGDTYDRAKELFPPKPSVDQEYSREGDCGIEFNWVDLKNPRFGNVFIYSKDGKVSQIDVATTRYHTAEGITIDSSPKEIRKHHEGLRAFVLSSGFSEATGGRPLVYWVDSEKGIAFAFAYSRSLRRRYLYLIVVFRPSSEICPFDEPLGADKRELPPYSLEPDDATDKKAEASTAHLPLTDSNGLDAGPRKR